MHLVLLNQYYPPDDAPTGVMLAEVAERLVREGHQVMVLCGPGGYAVGGDVADDRKVEGQRSEGASEHEAPNFRTTAASNPRVRRVRATRFGRRVYLAKLIDYATFYLGVAWNLLWLRADRIVALTTPPYLSVLARMVSKIRGGDHGHWVMDLYPDVMVAHGMLAKGGVVARMLGFLTRWGFGGKRCAFVSTLGPDMAERVGRYVEEEREVAVVPLWATGDGSGREEEEEVGSWRSVVGGEDSEGVRVWRESRGWGRDDLVLMYSGNMGLGHPFGEFLEAATFFGEGDGNAGGTPTLPCRFVFTGGGKRKGEIEEFVAAHPDGPVEVGDYVARSDLAVHLASADVHLVSLEPAWDGTMVPSKLQGIFSIGRPVIFVGSRICAIGRWILESGGGWVVAPGDVAALRAAIGEAGDEEEREKRGAAAQQFTTVHFDRERNATRLATICARCGMPGLPTTEPTTP